MYSTRFRNAFTYAASLHEKQTRKGTSVPYITHLRAVAALVGEAGGSEDEAIAALLHDAVEDQGGAPILQAIEERFGKTVADIVQSCSDTEVTPKPPWRERKEAYLEHLETATASALLVSCADKLHNARAVVSDLRLIGDRLWSRFNASKDESLWYYRALAEVFRRRAAPEMLVGELERTVQDMIRLANDAQTKPD